MGAKKEKKTKHKLDEDESPDSVTLPVRIVGKKDIGFFFFPQHLGTTSTLLHQLMHPRRITTVLLAVGPPDFTEGD
jgi:hypothetical protein